MTAAETTPVSCGCGVTPTAPGSVWWGCCPSTATPPSPERCCGRRCKPHLDGAMSLSPPRSALPTAPSTTVCARWARRARENSIKRGDITGLGRRSRDGRTALRRWDRRRLARSAFAGFIRRSKGPDLRPPWERSLHEREHLEGDGPVRND